MEGGSQRHGVAAQDAQLQIICPPLKGVVGGGIFPKHGQVGVQVLAHKSPQDHCAVQSHADIAGADGQMEQKVLPEGGVFRGPLVHALKELLQGDAEGVPRHRRLRWR